MADVGKILEGIATLLWPVIIIILILLFKPAVAAIIESAKSRKFTIKIGGQELTMEEANEQQRKLITDIQSRVIALESGTKDNIQSSLEISESSPPSQSVCETRILWVDDNPKNNSYFVQQLFDMGVNTDLALSTQEGLKRFNQVQYSLIISDIGRIERGMQRNTAGLDLLKEIRTKNPDIPFIILTTTNNVQKYKSQARGLGATLITSSPTELFAMLQREIKII